MSDYGTDSPNPSVFLFNQRMGPAATFLDEGSFNFSTLSHYNSLRSIIILAGTLCPVAFPLAEKCGVRCRYRIGEVTEY